MPAVRLLVLLSVASLSDAIWTPTARAADTVETWAPGATDIDYYVGVVGVGNGTRNAHVFGDIMLGYGVSERLSAFLGTNAQGSLLLGDGRPSLYFGVFGTPVGTDHVDVDLFLTFDIGGPAFTELQITPAVELNWDSSPSLLGWGVYVRTALVGHHHPGSADAQRDAEQQQAALLVVANPGVYVALGEEQQLLLEYDMAYHPGDLADERRWEMGGVAFGYNRVVSDSIELVTELSIDIAQDGQRAAWGITTGFIATLPPPAQRHAFSAAGM